ncbi:3-carboxy-cis,cis-mucoante lactonizing enzyme [Gonapodya prolifera JEL478]|uniref:3-carboxy-cis,cis-mucoante lactonizing enzyme n=1 Tax=Gonapodya prolifera (strain JEL478) TaxID=1344416 RepID=A0A139AJE8_GONPJ|nr:3-carboxy-cis,cis-mucoante lactonizing enzyme [Gonapodya prolifera JEL478]|eukprot:KXS16828.1 3-carboxy-cis,cis-mucoante lactonizing enzyme [Gonapodya prolifera JEL478]
MSAASSRTYTIIAGTYNASLLKLTFDPSTSSLSLSETISTSTSAGGPFDAVNPSWLEPHPTQNDLAYAADQSPEGRVVLFRTSPSGNVSLVASAPTGGFRPAHACTTADGRWVVLPHFNDGRVVALKVDPNKGAAAFDASSRFEIVYTGSGPMPLQAVAHPHMAVEHPTSGNVFVIDLGSDRIHELRLNASDTWEPVQSIVVQPAGSGPRHMRFSQDGLSAYLLCELTSTIHTFRVAAPSRGSSTPTLFEPVSVRSFLPPGAADAAEDKKLAGGEILLPKDGRQVIVSNRNDGNSGGDAIAVFPLDPPNSPELNTDPGFYRTGGLHLRGVELDLFEQKYLLAANMLSSSLTMFERDLNDAAGALKVVAKADVPKGVQVTTLLWVRP